MRTVKAFLFIGLTLLSILSWGQAKPLVISTNNTPLDRKALELISQEAFRRLGVDFKIISNPSERSLQLANQGEIDGDGLRVAGLNTQYPNLVQVPERFIGISFVAFSKDALIRLDNGWDSLKPYRVAFITGWKMFDLQVSEEHKEIVRYIEQAAYSVLNMVNLSLDLYKMEQGTYGH